MEARPLPKTTISLGTATPGGGFPLYGNAFAEVMNAADPTLSIEPRNTKGSNENIPLLESDQQKTEGAGKTGCALHPRSRVQCAQKNAHTSIQVQRRTLRPSLRNGFTAYSRSPW
jgi:hypothetical protein